MDGIRFKYHQTYLPPSTLLGLIHHFIPYHTRTILARVTWYVKEIIYARKCFVQCRCGRVNVDSIADRCRQ